MTYESVDDKSLSWIHLKNRQETGVLFENKPALYFCN